jgi:hypothetical protein
LLIVIILVIPLIFVILIIIIVANKRYNDTTSLLLVTNDINITVTVTWLNGVTNDTINEVSFLHKKLTPFFGVVGTLNNKESLKVTLAPLLNVVYTTIVLAAKVVKISIVFLLVHSIVCTLVAELINNFLTMMMKYLLCITLFSLFTIAV